MSQSVLVRKLRSSELDRILEIEHASFGKDAYDRNLFAEFLDKCGDLFLVAVVGREICGYMVTCIGARGRAEIVSVAVDPASRGKGIASVLMDSTLRRLRRRPVDRLTLMVRVANRPARKFYDKYKFEKVRIVPRYYENGANGLLMVRRLRTKAIPAPPKQDRKAP